MILQYKSRTAKPKIYIASFQVAQLQSHLKGDYVNFGFAVQDFMLQDHCNLLYTVVCRTVVMHQAGIGGGFEVFVAGGQ